MTALVHALLLLSLDSHDPVLEAIRNHTLTPDQMRELNFVSMEWQGRRIYARPGEWIVQLHRWVKYGPGGEVIDAGLESAGPATPGTEFQAQLDGLGLGLRFKQYLGVK